MSAADGVAEWVDANWSGEMSLAEWWQRLADVGYAFPAWPPGFGGRGTGQSDDRAIRQRLGSMGVIGPPAGTAPNMGVPTLLAHGTDEQKERFVTPAVTGREAWCQLFSEPGAGSDLASLACRAERDGDEFVVTGQKVWNSGADVSEWGMLLARTNPDVPKHAGITWMLVDMRQPGVEVRPLVQMNGSADFCEVFLSDARVPLDNVVGGIDNGWNIARTTLTYERASVGQRVPKGLLQVKAGTMPGNLDRPVGELVEQARRAGSPRREVMLGARSIATLASELGLAEDVVVRDRLADYYARSEVHRRTGQRRGDLTKLGLALLAHRSRDLSMSLLGAEGMLTGEDARDHGRVQQACLSSFVPSLGGGTNEIQRNIIGERILGLPREPSADAEVPFRQLRRS